MLSRAESLPPTQHMSSWCRTTGNQQNDWNVFTFFLQDSFRKAFGVTIVTLLKDDWDPKSSLNSFCTIMKIIVKIIVMIEFKLMNLSITICLSSMIATTSLIWALLQYNTNTQVQMSPIVATNYIWRLPLSPVSRYTVSTVSLKIIDVS